MQSICVIIRFNQSFSKFDIMTSGLQRGDLIILAARPSMGKTAMALNIAQQVAKKKNVAIFSLEMSSQQLVDRMLAAEAQVNSWHLRTGQLKSDEDFDRYKTFLKKAKLLGATRPITDWGKIAASIGDTEIATGNTGSTTVTPLSAVGATTQTKADIPQSLEAEAARIRAEQLTREEKERAVLSGARRAPEKKR